MPSGVLGPQGRPVDPQGTGPIFPEAAEPAELAQPARDVAVDQQGLVVGSGIVIRRGVAQHDVKDAGHLVSRGDDGTLVSAPRRDGALVAGELAVAGACGGMGHLDEGGPQVLRPLAGGAGAPLAGTFVVAE